MSAITREVVIEIVEVDNPEVYASQAATSATAAEAARVAAVAAQTAAVAAKVAAEAAQTAAAASAATATTKAGEANSSASAAATSATAAEAAKVAAQTAQTAAVAAKNAAETAQAAAAAKYTDFDNRYLGPKSTNPTTDNNGGALGNGALYFNATVFEMRVWNGTAWQNTPFSLPTHTHNWTDITGKPTTFAPAAHNHPTTDITGLGTAATRNVAASGNASASEIVKGDDTRLSGGGGGMKNRIINGDMRIDQRNSGAAITPATAGYTLDRWNFQTNVASKIQFGRNLNSIAPPAGFTNYLGMQCAAAYSPLAGDWFQLSQFIEGVNCYDLDFGKSTAKTITLSFWVRSSIAGQWGGSIRNASSGRSYPFAYTVGAANTWEKKTIAIVGDTAGTWLTDTGTGINLTFSLAMGSTYTGTAGAWASANYSSSTGSNSLVSTLNATLYITGVQLEAGSTATDFEWRDYGRELAMCQRYCAVFSAGAAYLPLGTGVAWATTTARIIVNTAAMRLSKTIATSAGTAIYLNANGNWVASTAISLIYQNESQALIDVTCAGLTVGQGVVALINTNNWLRIEAEL